MKTIEQRRKKVGSKYYRSGYGRTRARVKNVYLIDGKLYAKDNGTTEFDALFGELQGYVRINAYQMDGNEFYAQPAAGFSHEEYKGIHLNK